MWLSRDLDMERARTADFSMSMSRPSQPDPYGHHHVVTAPPSLPMGTIIIAGAQSLLKMITLKFIVNNWSAKF